MMMKTAGTVLPAGTDAASVPAEELDVLMIGNSFSVCVGKNLPDIVAASKKHRLRLTSAYIGGCSLEKHCDNITEADKDPGFRPYDAGVWTSDAPEVKKSFKCNVNELLHGNKYDIVTIQQASHFSWDSATYQPFAGRLIEYIRKHNPDAGIVIQQTWAYRCDDGRIRRGRNGEWGFDAQGMHERLAAAYSALAKEYSLRIIPSGEAVRIARERCVEKYVPPAPDDLKKLKYPALPAQSEYDVVGNDWWSAEGSSESMAFRSDSIHLNRFGEYLQACVWYAVLFGEDPLSIKYDPPRISAERCRFLRECAAEAVNGGTSQKTSVSNEK